MTMIPDVVLRQTSEENNSTYSQWMVGDNHTFYPTYQTTKSVPSGMYELYYDHNKQSAALKNLKLNLDDLFVLPSGEYDEILNDLRNFWERTDIFKTYGFVHKRGILLHGAPGCGKSGLIQLICQEIINVHNGIIFNVNDDDLLSYYISYIDSFRMIEPTRPIVVIFEDIDEIVGSDKYTVSQVLNVLDGVKQVSNVVYLATTNYPEKLEERVSNRPSRFDRKYKIELPSDSVRRAFFERKLGSDYKDLETWVKDSKGLSLAHCKEMIISTILLGNSYENTLEQLGVLKKSSRKHVTGFSKNS